MSGTTPTSSEEAAASPITLPRTVDGWAALLLVLVGFVWLLYEKQFAAAVPVLGLAAQQVRMSGKLAGALTTAYMAFVGSREAAQSNETLKAAVKDIQDNPTMPGTPGWMDRNG